MKKIILLIAILVVSLTSFGCNNMVAVLVSPTNYEKKIPAEYDLRKEAKRQKILVVVDRAPASGPNKKVMPLLAAMVENFLIKKAKIGKKYILPYEEADPLSNIEGDVLLADPVKIGSDAGADLVLYVLIESYNIRMIDKRRGYFTATMVTRSMLFDVASREILWTADGDGKRVAVKVELETQGRARAIERLNMTTSHCITRCLYNCSKRLFKTADELRSHDELINWQ
ncbi:MAG: hypothetical protein KAJ07_08020 [Planctomycetes bacterium]|nr:hypothetical protein [Planctomycetota bacterium]